MKCPRCKNQNFSTTRDVCNPLKNIGGKEKYNTFDTRRYVCLQCGYAFMTKEVFYREIEVRRNQLDLFEAETQKRKKDDTYD